MGDAVAGEGLGQDAGVEGLEPGEQGVSRRVVRAIQGFTFQLYLNPFTRRVLRNVLRLTNRVVNTNSVGHNLKIWSNYDWSAQGEHWAHSPEWKQSIVDYILLPNVPEGGVVLEIGPGAGRWTTYLADRAQRLLVVDLTSECIDLCKERFHDRTNIEYFVNDGKDLGFIEDASVDRIWSWDVFVHINQQGVRGYVEQFARILRPGGCAVLHHSAKGVNFGWRSNMTAVKMQEFCRELGLELRQFDSWGEAGEFRFWPELPPEENADVVSVIRRP